MRNLVLVAVAAALVLALAGPVHAGETYISINGGGYWPGDGLPEDYDPGLSGGLSYILVNEYAGFEFGLNGYTASSNLYDEDMAALGGEMLVHFHATDSVFRPFIAFGLGKYRSAFDFKDTDVLNTPVTKKFDGSGTVLKAGLRIFMGEKFFIGLYYKHLTNKVDIPPGVFYFGHPYFQGGSRDLGGDMASFEIGIVDF